MYIGYRVRPDIIRADIAGIVTAFVLFGGALMVWHIVRLKRETKRRLEAEREATEKKQ